jgi:hypothetical protein
LGRENEALRDFAAAFALQAFEGNDADTSGDERVLQGPQFGRKLKLLSESGIALAKAGSQFRRFA